ncbi:MAG: S-layer homology domain-containing protein [Oscillospiraceae bacterium]
MGPDTYYTKAVAWAAENGVVAGVSATRFDPAANITREQMAAILFRYAAKSGLDTSARGDTAAFPDRDRVAPYASDALRWCLAEGIISGFAENGTVYLAPQGSATREQVAAILMRYCKHIGA